MAANIRDAFFLRDAHGDRMSYISPAYDEIWGRNCESRSMAILPLMVSDEAVGVIELSIGIGAQAAVGLELEITESPMIELA